MGVGALDCKTRSGKTCKLPFTYNGIKYGHCTDEDNRGVHWCSTTTDDNDQYIHGKWENCACETEACCPPGKV